MLLLHCDSIDYRPVEKENMIAEKIYNMETKTVDEVLVAFVTIETGDTHNVALDATVQIRDVMKKVACPRLLLYPYAHLSSDLAKPSKALDVFLKMAEYTEDLDMSRAPFGWTKSYHVKVKGHPLAESSKVIRPTPQDADHAHDDCTVSDALKEESKLESHWHILSPDGTMVKVEDFDFTGHKKLETLARYESEKKRHVDKPPPHVSLMKKMAIADYESASDHGNMRFFPNGRLIKSLIETHVTNRVREYGGYEVETPIMYDSEHPSMVSYFNRFPARQYTIDSENRQFFLRFAACFGQFLMANQFQMSHHNLPYRLYEMTRYSFRREQSGELVGLRRLRAFTMPDCHAFCKDIPQAVDELKVRFELSERVLSELGIVKDDYEMALRFTEAFYIKNGDMIMELIKRHGKPVLVEMWKERFFYFVLKWEFNFVDGLGKASALSTDQIDVENGDRYGIEFIDENNTPQTPVILHNSPSGAIERIIYALLEKAAADIQKGRRPSFPLWLSPTQVRILPIREEFTGFAKSLMENLTSNKIRVDMDERNQSVGKRIREAEKEWVPYILVIGEKEVQSDELSVRDRRTGSVRQISFESFVDEIHARTRDMPFAGLNLPKYLSKRPQLMV